LIDLNKSPLKISAKVAVGVLRDSKIFGAPICRAHRAVIFAVAQLSCKLRPTWLACSLYAAIISSLLNIYYPKRDLNPQPLRTPFNALHGSCSRPIVTNYDHADDAAAGKSHHPIH